MPGPVLISERQADYQNTEVSTAQTIRDMCAHVRAATQDPLVRRVALEISGVPLSVWAAGACPLSRRQLAEKVWAWCKRNIKFVPDEEQIWKLLGRREELELLISPSVMLRPELLEHVRGYKGMEGDCDCFVMTAMSLLACLGVPPLFETLKCDVDSPWRWSHICAGALLEDGSIFPVDASHGEYAGWRVPGRDIFESQLWDMNGNKVSGGNMRGLSGYVRERGWTGSEMTSSGRVAGPYPNLDVMTAYRRRGLNAIADGKYGMGACVGGFDEYGMACTDFTPITSDPTATAQALQYLNSTSAGSAPSSGGSSWANLFGQLLNSGTRLASQEIGSGATVLPNGNVLLPSGQVVSGSPASSLGISSSSLLIGGLLVGGLILVSVLKK